jgi:dolichyl-phosphate-mannose-protein mannosyltransferase
VFDEAHFGRYATLYIKGTHFFDIHPPLGKLMFMVASRMAGYDGHFDFHASYVYDGNFYIAMRTVTAFFSSLTPPTTYLCLLEMGKSNLIAAFAASLVLFDNCILLEGRLILMDAHLLYFLSAAYYFHKRRRNAPEYSREWYIITTLCGINMALCMSVKWTALATVALIGIETLLELIKRIATYSNIEQMARDWCVRGLLLGFLPVCIYLFIWSIHFRLLYHSGPGDNMMPSEFLKRLEGNNVKEDVVPFSLFESIIYVHHRMYEHNKGITEPHPLMSSWWSWPVMLK